MAGAEITAPSLDRFSSSLLEAADLVGDLGASLGPTAQHVLGVVQAPVRTGRLAASVDAVVDAAGFTLTAGGPSAPYGPIVHARNPFLTRALEQQQGEIVDDAAAHLNHALAQIKD